MSFSDPVKHKTLFFSDWHLGTQKTQAKRLYEFLCRNDADTIYLVGDIIEVVDLGHWPIYHDLILKLLCDRALKGTKIVFVPGNHDNLFRNHIGRYGNLDILNHAHHQCVDGRMLLIMHGDETDVLRLETPLWLITKFEKYSRIHLWEILRNFFTTFIDKHTLRYENKIVKLTKSFGFNGVVCGHIHFPKIVERENGFLYINSGDWVHHCSAIAEDRNGELKILYG